MDKKGEGTSQAIGFVRDGFAVLYEYTLLRLSLLLADDGLLAVRTDRNDCDRCGKLLLKESDIVPEVFGELFLALHLGHVGLPAGHSDIDRLDVLLNREGELGGLDSLYLISHTSLDFVKVIEDVALHHDELSDTVEHDCIAESHEVNPTATTLTAGHCTVFMTEVTDALAGGIEKLGREGTAADAGTVCLEDTEHLTNLVGGHAEAGTCTGADGVGRGHEGIRTEVDVEQSALRTFAKHTLAFGEKAVDEEFGINDTEALEIDDGIHPLLLKFVKILGSCTESVELIEVTLTER